MAYRKEIEEIWLVGLGQVEDSAIGVEPDEFERFEDTLSKLAQVPKSEIDEKRKKS